MSISKEDQENLIQEFNANRFEVVVGAFDKDPIKAASFLKANEGKLDQKAKEKLNDPYDGHEDLNAAYTALTNFKEGKLGEALKNLSALKINAPDKIADILYDNRSQFKDVLQEMLKADGMTGVKAAFEARRDQDAIKLFQKTFNKDNGNPELSKIKTITAIVDHVHGNQRVDKKKLGEYLSDESAVSVLDQFTQKIDFSDKGFVEGMRAYLDTFQLSGEGQKIDRIMESFGKCYFATGQDKAQFKDADASYVLAFSTIMLNSFLHNPSAKGKMDLAGFIKQNEGLNTKQTEDQSAGEHFTKYQNFKSGFLSKIFDNIQQEPFKFPGAVEFSKPVTKQAWPSKVMSEVKKITNFISSIGKKKKGYAQLHNPKSMKNGRL